MSDKIWQAEQLPYPRDGDYYGAKMGLFDLSEDTEKIVGKLNAGNTFMYLFRRFGYPFFGWDGYKKLVQYAITTPMPGVILTVEPNVTGGGTFGYMLREGIDKACEAEERKPWQDQYKRFEAWAIETKGIETIHQFYEPDKDKLNRVWRTWAAANKANDFKSHKEAEKVFYDQQAKITQDLLDEYLKIEPHPTIAPLEDRADNSIMKQCHVALCAAIRDLLRPVYVRDVMINICGEVRDAENDDNAVDCAAGSICGVGDKLDE